VVVFISAAVNAGLDEALMTAISVVALVLFIFVAPVTVETLSHGRSLGKLAVGARIVRDDGGSIGLRHAAIRGMARRCSNIQSPSEAERCFVGLLMRERSDW